MLIPVLPQRHVAAGGGLGLDRGDVRHGIDREFHPRPDLAGVGVVGRDWRNQIAAIRHHGGKTSGRVVNQHLGSSVSVNGEEFHVDAAPAFPEQDAEGINSVLRHDDVERCVRVVGGTSVLASGTVAETEQSAQRVSGIRSGTTGPPVIHVEAEEISPRLQIEVGGEFIDGIVETEVGCSRAGQAGNLRVRIKDAAVRGGTADSLRVVEVENISNVKTAIWIGWWIASGQNQVGIGLIVRRVDVTVRQFDFRPGHIVTGVAAAIALVRIAGAINLHGFPDVEAGAADVGDLHFVGGGNRPEVSRHGKDPGVRDRHRVSLLREAIDQRVRVVA